MRKIRSSVIIVSLILGATGIGIWAASRATNHAKAEHVEDREGIPVTGGIFVMPPVY